MDFATFRKRINPLALAVAFAVPTGLVIDSIIGDWASTRTGVVQISVSETLSATYIVGGADMAALKSSIEAVGGKKVWVGDQ